MKEKKRWITVLDVIDHEDNGFPLFMTILSISSIWVSTAGESKAEYTFLHGVQASTSAFSV